MTRFLPLIVFGTYVLTALWGLSVNSLTGFAPPIWLPAGIGIAAVLLGGRAMALVIFAASFCVDYFTDTPITAAFAIATGNALEALVARELLSRKRNFDWSFENVGDVFRFILLGAFASTLISSVIGSTAIYLTDVPNATEMPHSFIIWWLGNALGVLIATPAIMLAKTWKTLRVSRQKIGEFLGLVAVTILLAAYLFVDWEPLTQFYPVMLRRIYVAFPLFIWAILRFGSLGIATVMMIFVSFASLSAPTNLPIFASSEATVSIYSLQIFLGITTISGHILAAAIAQFQLSEKRFRTMFELSGVPMAKVNNQGRFILVNDKFCEMTGYSREELIRKTFAEITHPDDIASEAVLFERLLTKLDKAFHVEKRYIRKDGTIIWIQIDAALMEREFHDEPTSIAVVQDITQRKLAEKEAEESQRLAEGANRAKSIFLAQMSHEIRTPLGVILGFSELLKDQKLPPDLRTEFTGTIHRNAEELGRLIDDILDLSKVEAGRLDILREEMSLDDLIKDLRETFTAPAQAKGLKLEFSMAPGLPDRILTDQKRIRQILVNMIGNAIKYTDKGGIYVEVACDHHCKDDGSHLSFKVKDSGCGIDKDELPRLFQPFSQSMRAKSQNIRGTGLGLVLSKQLAKLLGGDVKLLFSQPGVGSTFEITVNGCAGHPVHQAPKAEATVRSQKAVLAESSHRLDKIKVLLAEDTPDQAILIRHLLTDLGATVEAVENGALAVEKALVDRFDIILMDMQMPVLNGYDAARMLRREGIKTPIIALTAQAMREDPAKCVDAGCSDHVAKPFTIESLQAKISAWL